MPMPLVTVLLVIGAVCAALGGSVCFTIAAVCAGFALGAELSRFWINGIEPSAPAPQVRPTGDTVGDRL